MSRIGRTPIAVPNAVDVKIDGSHITVKGPKGTLERTIHHDMTAELKDGSINVLRPGDDKLHRSLHGLTRTLIANMVKGVTDGFSKELQVNGVGYRALKQGTQLVMNLGYSHQVFMDEIPGISIEVPEPSKIIIRGIDIQLVGQFAADVRSKRPPEPYKGKGIKYINEVLRHKEGKTGSK